MTYTVQAFIDGYVPPLGTDVAHFDTLPECVKYLARKQARALRYDAGDGDPFALIWKGEHTDITDIYPDYELRFNDEGDPVYTPY